VEEGGPCGRDGSCGVVESLWMMTDRAVCRAQIAQE